MIAFRLHVLNWNFLLMKRIETCRSAIEIIAGRISSARKRKFYFVYPHNAPVSGVIRNDSGISQQWQVRYIVVSIQKLIPTAD